MEGKMEVQQRAVAVAVVAADRAVDVLYCTVP